MQRIRTWSAALVVLALTVLVMACDSGSGTGTTPQSDTFTLTVTLQGLGVGTVSNDATGIACDTTGATCSADIPEGTEVTLTATPAAGSEFVGWGSDGRANPLTFTMDADKDVTAEFDNPALAMETVGSGGGTVMSRDSAITLVVPEGALSGDEDITIEIVDPADLGAEWSDLRDSSAIAAAYQMGPDGLQFSVPAEVRLGTGDAMVTSDSVRAGIPTLSTAQADTVAELDSIGADIDLATGQVTTAGRLTHFSPLVKEDRLVEISLDGDLSPMNVGESRLLVIDAFGEHYDKPVNGDFETTIVTADGADASFYISPGGTVNVDFTCTEARTITVTVKASFKTSGGNLRSAVFPITIDCTGNSLSVTTSGEGSGTVTGPDARGRDGGINCGSQGTDCAEDYGPGTSVSLTAAPDDGSYLAGWTVDGEAVTGNPDGTLDVTMDGDHTVDARFEPVVSEDLTVSLDGSGDGTVTSDPAGIDCTKTGTSVTGTCTGTFDHGSTVALTATDGDGSTITDWSGDGATDIDGRRLVDMTGTAAVGMTFPVVPTDILVFQLASLGVYYLEGMSLMPALFPFLQPTGDIAKMTTGEACPTVLVAGDGAALAINSCTGELRGQYDFSGPSFYDALAMVPPDDAPDAEFQLLLTGQDWVHCFILDDGSTDSCVGIYGGANIPDAQLIDHDPRAGAIYVDNSSGTIRYELFDPDLGWFDGHPIWIAGPHVPGTHTSAVSGPASGVTFTPPAALLATAWEWVGSTKTGRLHYVATHSDDPNTDPEGTLVGDLAGSDPRRIRCDLDSGICGITDFSGSLVTIVTWDGLTLPTITDVTTAGQVASGPVGLDVYGHFIVTAGYNDDQYSIIEVDDAGAIVNVTTQALPAGCSAPGHAMFLRDGANTILISCNASQAIVRIPNAF